MSYPPFPSDTVDRLGYTPLDGLRGVLLRHVTTQKTYVVTGFCWLGQTDEWGFTHKEWPLSLMGVEFVRPMSHLRSRTLSGSVRFEDVEGKLAALPLPAESPLVHYSQATGPAVTPELQAVFGTFGIVNGLVKYPDGRISVESQGGFVVDYLPLPGEGGV